MGVKYHRGKQDETAMNVGVLCAIVLNVMVEVDVPKRNRQLNLLGEASKKSNKRMTEFDFTVNICDSQLQHEHWLVGEFCKKANLCLTEGSAL